MAESAALSPAAQEASLRKPDERLDSKRSRLYQETIGLVLDIPTTIIWTGSYPKKGSVHD